MKTVKEFKDAALEFVDGDKAVDKNGIQLVGMDVAQVIDDLDSYSDDLMTEFACRTNTGQTPSFYGVVEVEFRDGETDKGIVNSFSWGIYGIGSDIIKWRPVINEGKMEGKTNNPRVSERKDIPECNPEIKIISSASDCDVTIGKSGLEGFNCRCVMVDVNQVYTKEMHEAGEFPPVGSKFMLAKKINYQMLDKFQGVECTVIGHCKSLEGDDVITFSETNRGYACMLHFPECIKPIDTRTEEEKLVDEIMEFIDVEPDDRIKPKSLIYRIIKAGYRKP